MKIYTNRRLQSNDTLDVIKKFEGTKLWVLMYDKEYEEFEYHRIEKIDDYQVRYLEYVNDPHFSTCRCDVYTCQTIKPIKVYDALFSPEIPFRVLTDSEIIEIMEEKRSR